MKIDPYYQRRRCSTMTLVSGNISFKRTFGFCGEGASNDTGRSKRRFFDAFGVRDLNYYAIFQ